MGDTVSVENFFSTFLSTLANRLIMCVLKMLV